MPVSQIPWICLSDLEVCFTYPLSTNTREHVLIYLKFLVPWSWRLRGLTVLTELWKLIYTCPAFQNI